jgi:hypothetical protein
MNILIRSAACHCVMKKPKREGKSELSRLSQLAAFLRFRSALATCDEFGFKAVNRNVGGSNPPRCGPQKTPSDLSSENCTMNIESKRLRRDEVVAQHTEFIRVAMLRSLTVSR